MRQPLDRLLRPRSIALIGDREAKKVLRECRRVGFDGPIYPVSRSRRTIAGEPCFARLEDLPEAPDVSFVAIPADPAIEAVQLLSDMGTGGAVVYASGFSEIGDIGKERQAKIVAAAGDMALVGPNCYGVLNYLDGVALWPDDHGGTRVDRGVAIISQSGNVAISLSMQMRSLPVAQMISLGNQAKESVADLVQALLRDDRVTAIGLFIEGIGDMAAFAAVTAAAARKGVPVVVLKTGASEAATRVALSHTSSMTGSSAAFDAVCERCAVIQVKSLTQFLEFLKFLHVHPGLPGKRLLTLSCSGGEAGVLADLAHEIGLPMPPLDDDRVAALHAILGDKVAIYNPLDYHTYIWGDQVAMAACFTEALRQDVDVALLALDTPDNPDLELFGWAEAEAGIIAAKQETGRATIVAASLPESMPVPLGRRFLAAGVVPMQGFDDALQIVDRAAWYWESRQRVGEGPPLLGAGGPPSGAVRTLDEWRSKKALAAFGLPVPEGAMVSSPTETVAAAEALGYPVVLKACSAELAHKTETGGVALNLVDADAVRQAADRMASLADLMIVEKMVDDAVCELIVGVTHDDSVGLMLMVGAGGVLAELMNDAMILLPPVSPEAAERALSRLAVDKLLRGFRGKPVGDRDAVIAAIRSVAAFAETHADRLLELDVNPLMVRADGVVAADALIRWTEE